MLPRAICFDLDGTLVDSLPDIIASFRQAFTELGLPVPDEDLVRGEVGLPLEDMYAVFAPASAVTALAAAYRRTYPLRFTEQSAPFPEVRPVLTALQARGYLLAVATTKRSPLARDLVAALGLDDLIDHVQGTDGFPHKPAPDVIHRALAALGAEGAWMVGDTRHDLEAGRAAGLATYGVARPGSSHDWDQLLAAGPDRLETSLLPLLEVAGSGRQPEPADHVRADRL